LHESSQAVEIVSTWLAPSGRLGDLKKLNDVGRAIFSNVAPVSEEAALAALERAVTDSDFTSTENCSRHQFVRVARSIAYDPRFFDRAVRVVVSFALAEPIGSNNQTARDILKSLFYCHLSGTEARSPQRSKTARTLLTSSDDRERKLGLGLLDAALEASQFTSVHSFEFGARKRGFGWWPRTQNDVRDWYMPFLDIAVEIGSTNTSHGREARLVLGESVRGLWVRAGLTDEIATAAKALKVIDGWPEGWLATRRILHWDRAVLSSDSISRLLVLERELAPVDLRAQIGAKVLARGSFAHDIDPAENEDGTDADLASRLRASETAAENLGKAAAHDEGLLLELLPDLLRNGNNGKVWNFGFGIGQESSDVDALMEGARTLIADDISGSVSLIFICGLLSGWSKVKPLDAEAFLDRALHDEVWGRWFPELQLRLGLASTGYQRLLQSLELGISPIWQYQYLGMGRATDPLTIEQISNLAGIISRKQNGISVAIHILRMVVHCASEKDAEYRTELGRLSIAFLRDLNWLNFQSDNGRVDHDIDVILEFALATPGDDAGKLEVMSNLVALGRSQRRSYSFAHSRFLTPFFKHFPRETLDTIYVPDDDGTYRSAVRIVSRSDSARHETAVRKVPTDALIDWCNTSPTDRYIFAAETCHLFEKGSEEAKPQSISDVAVRILAAADDKAKVLSIFIDRFRPTILSGHLSAVLRERLTLLAKLNPTGDPKMQAKIEEAQRLFGEWISIKEKSEEAEEKARSENFE